MIFEQIECGGDRNYAYLVCGEDRKSAVAVDPSDRPENIQERADANKCKVKYVINTHGHGDHTGGNSFFVNGDGAQIVAHERASAVDIGVPDGRELDLGALKFRFIHTPGHTPDSLCVKIGGELMTGDTLFVGKIGGTYTREDAAVEFESLKKLMELGDDVRVWPGHNYGRQASSTIGREKETNPFIQRLDDFEEFMRLKNNWDRYKKEHGLV